MEHDFKVEKAKIPDVAEMHRLINRFAQKGEMLARPLSELYEEIRDFLVIKKDDRVLACAALHVAWEDLAEVRSMAVDEEWQNKGLGTVLLKACLEEARELGIKTIFCFTYRPAFFKRYNFMDIDKMELPRKVWTDCYRCPKFPNCDETALIYNAGESA
jgi:amino-acid N-acetyltransferase